MHTCVVGSQNQDILGLTHPNVRGLVAGWVPILPTTFTVATTMWVSVEPLIAQSITSLSRLTTPQKSMENAVIV
uniref:Uncharacterized protein n=1 Tax=Heterorhabditis bacteriophora TaxID=37862 RepID=A0A1I7WI89_HETBA